MHGLDQKRQFTLWKRIIRSEGGHDVSSQFDRILSHVGFSRIDFLHVCLRSLCCLVDSRMSIASEDERISEQDGHSFRVQADLYTYEAAVACTTYLKRRRTSGRALSPVSLASAGRD